MSRPSRRWEPAPMEVRQMADLLERRWQLSIIYAALSGAIRFNEFADAVAGISPRMLSDGRRGLEAARHRAGPRKRRRADHRRDARLRQRPRELIDAASRPARPCSAR